MKVKRSVIISILLILPMILQSKQNNYVIIKKGETLWRISKRYNIPLETLCAINKIKDKSKVKAGTKIYLYPKETNPVVLKLKLSKPVEGSILNGFNQGKNIIQNNGIEFRTLKAAPVKAVEQGVVKYSGNMRGYGNVIIIEHSYSISMIYAYLDKILVKNGTKVKKEEVIGTVGKNNFNDLPILHFELLNNGKPINPIQYFN